MAHPEQREFFIATRDRFPTAFRDVTVLEVGSLNINGSVRDFFTPIEYVGADLIEGPGVDVVCAGQDLTYPDRSFDVVVSAECFEHNAYWVETFDNMHRMAARWVFFTCASTGRPEHGTHGEHPSDSPATHDYYRNLTEDDFRGAFDLNDMFTEYEFIYNPSSCDLYFWGCVR